MLPVTELLQRYRGKVVTNAACENLAIVDVTADSRQVRNGSLFVAVRGEKYNGEEFIPQALAAGAAVIVAEKEIAAAENQNICLVKVDNSRRALAQFAAAIYAPQPEYMVAITGTDGKTSTAEFFRQILDMAGEKAASIGTLGVYGAAGKIKDIAALNTTPDPVLLHRTLQKLAGDGYKYCAVEASSHGLHQYRLDGIDFTAAAFTNLASDHLDYHKTKEEYFTAKKRLFAELLPEDKTAVLNCDDAMFPALKDVCSRRGIEVVTFGKSTVADLRLINTRPGGGGQKTEIEIFGKKYVCELAPVGEFQVMNILAALGLVHSCGLDIAGLIDGLSSLKGIRGRLEKVAVHPCGANIYIDFAHTEDALRKLLQTLRPHAKGRLLVVFGCGGDRDKSKRPLMGAVAAQLADVVIVTDDNPRGENPENIRRQVIAGCGSAKNIGDRERAITYAVEMLQPDDVLVIAGKGHETTQIIGDSELPFDDAEAVRRAVRRG